MDRSAWRRLVVVAATAVVGGAGCGSGVSEAPTPEARTTAVSTNTTREGEFPRGDAAKPEVSWDTERDRVFARFLENNAAGMVRKAAVGIERRGDLKIELSRDVEPDDTLPLTTSLMAGARKDFPERPFTLSLYDPQGEPVLKARFRPGEGVNYQIAHGGKGAPEQAPKAAGTPGAGGPLERGGVTDRDQKFAAWAEEHGRSMLRYVEADLERHGRLWFGITHEVKPEDVRPLAQSLLEGARKEFARDDLVATVFDPDGERIGRARLGGGGEINWEK